MNVTAPNPVTNTELSHALGRALGRPALLPVPGLAVKLLYGEMAEMVTTGQRVVPARLRKLGYGFRHPESSRRCATSCRTREGPPPRARAAARVPAGSRCSRSLRPARNLERLTPPWLRFEVLTPEPIEMQVGTLIDYRLRVHGIPLRWTSRIEEWEPGRSFVDRQLRGPYGLWHHRHTFAADGEATIVRDTVDYALPFGPLGELAHALFVRRDLERIFAFRRRGGPAALSDRRPARARRQQRVSAAILWLRRDLRIHDHPALRAALDTGAAASCRCSASTTACCKGRHASGPRTQFLLECLADLDASLRQRGSRLFVRHGRPERSCSSWRGSSGPSSVHFSADVWPFARRRQDAVSRALRAEGVAVEAHPGLFAVDRLRDITHRVRRPLHGVHALLPQLGRTGHVGTCWALRASFPAPGTTVAAGALPGLEELGLEQECSDPATGGEMAARRALTRFLGDPVAAYADGRDILTGENVSRLSPYLHFGCLSPREIEERLGGGEGAQAFRRQLCWRDFYAHVLGHFPANARSEYQERYRGTIRWSHARAAVRGLVRGTDRLPDRRCRDAPVASRGLDAQPRAAAGRIVPDQGPRHRLALGRAVVHAPAARR